MDVLNGLNNIVFEIDKWHGDSAVKQINWLVFEMLF